MRGCGDCSAKSNCMSVVGIETDYGPKRAIDQSSCNKDFSCADGFCPSFVTIHGGKPRRGKQQAGGDAFGDLPEPKLPDLTKPYNILVTGVGGTGVVTIGAVIGRAAADEGQGCHRARYGGPRAEGRPGLVAYPHRAATRRSPGDPHRDGRGRRHHRMRRSGCDRR